VGAGTTLRKAAIHRDYLDRRTSAHLLDDSVCRTAGFSGRGAALLLVHSLPLNGKDGDSGARTPKPPVFVCNPRTITRDPSN